jgi:hypothetical protein
MMNLDAKPGMLYALEVSVRTEAAANENGGSFEIHVVQTERIGK